VRQRRRLVAARFPRRPDGADPHLHTRLLDAREGIDAADAQRRLELPRFQIGGRHAELVNAAIEDAVHEIAGDGEIDAGAADAGDGDADDRAAGVDERAARIARMHAAVDLDPLDRALLILANAG